jgi:hypothetical protein
VRVLDRVISPLRRALRGIGWGAMPGGPGRTDMWAELDDLEAKRRREREVWRRGVDEGPKTPAP